jgi:hypothetical protein
MGGKTNTISLLSAQKLVNLSQINGQLPFLKVFYRFKKIRLTISMIVSCHVKRVQKYNYKINENLKKNSTLLKSLHPI